MFRLVFGGNLLPRINEVDVDARVLLTALGLSLVASMLFGVLPALQLSRVSQLQAMGARGSGATRRETRRARRSSSASWCSRRCCSSARDCSSTASSACRESRRATTRRTRSRSSWCCRPDYATERKAATIESLLARLRSQPEVEDAGFAYAGILLGVQDTVGTFMPPGRTLEEMQAEHAKPRLKSLSHGLSRGDGRAAAERPPSRRARRRRRRRSARS